MKTYNVSLDLIPRIALLLEIQADNEEEAQDKAVELVLKDPAYRVLHPVNGDCVEVTGDDVHVDYAEAQ